MTHGGPDPATRVRWIAVPREFVLISVVVLAAVGLYVVWAWPRDLESQDVRGAEARIRQAASPLVVGVEAGIDSVDGNLLFIDLVAGANDAQARDVWCELVLPTGIDPTLVLVGPIDIAGTWAAPADCTDPASIPAFVPWPTFQAPV